MSRRNRNIFMFADLDDFSDSNARERFSQFDWFLAFLDKLCAHSSGYSGEWRSKTVLGTPNAFRQNEFRCRKLAADLRQSADRMLAQWAIEMVEKAIFS
jgi:hypothetical protein